MTPRKRTAVALVFAASVPLLAQTGRAQHWVATWAPALVVRPVPVAPAAPAATPAPVAATSPVAVTPAPAASAAPAPARGGGPPLVVLNRTIRQIVRVSLGGRSVRVVLSNAFGTAPLHVGAAHIALRECADEQPTCKRSADTAIVAPAHQLTIDGKTAFVLPPGASLVSDPVALTVAPLSDVAIDLYLPEDPSGAPSPLTWHSGALQTSYVSAEGNLAGTPAIDALAQPASWFLLSRVEVAAPDNAGVIVAFGDSITEGARSTVNTNHRWPDLVARRLAAVRGGRPMAVVNAGIGGNQLLRDGAGANALARFDRDVLMQTGVTHVVVLEGINDIGQGRSNPTPTAADLIGVHRQLIARAHARGLTIYGATLTPFEGANYYTVEGEAKRAALNDWIRTSGEYDGVIDFDKATRDPASPLRFLPLYDSGDHLHPADAGYEAMAAAIDLGLFK